VSAALLQAQVHLARHQFSAARAGSLAVLEAHPRLAAALATLGDAQLELGAYDEAAATYAGLASTTNVPAVTARLARLAALTGALSKGRRLAGEAIEVVAADPDAAATDLAWYHTLAGSLAFQAGDLPGAAAAYRAALDAWPGSAAALAGLGRTLAASGETEAAIATYQRSVAIVPGPDAVAALGDLLTVAGRAAEAEAAHAQLDAVATLAAAAGLHDRQLALFLANHGRDPARAVDVARADLARRGDVYAHDALAWALYAAGDLDAAAAQAAAARALGTEDALLDYHAGMIAAARGDEAEARALLAAALDRNPAFDPLQAPRAAAALAALGGPVR
jgi:tetratricopeptide (TPR) repeat protein